MTFSNFSCLFLGSSTFSCFLSEYLFKRLVVVVIPHVGSAKWFVDNVRGDPNRLACGARRISAFTEKAYYSALCENSVQKSAEDIDSLLAWPSCM